MEGILRIEHFIGDPANLFIQLTNKVEWDERMVARKTASYGKAYNYSQMEYPFRPMLPELQMVILQLEAVIGFEANNCLINYYADGKAKMGFHADQTDILDAGTGIAIISLGETRTLQFKNKGEKSMLMDYVLTAGSLIYMTQEVQDHWLHAIPTTDTCNPRISLTFRRIVNNPVKG